MESLVLSRLDWKITRWTAITFVENLIARGAFRILPTDRFRGATLRADQIPKLESCLIGHTRFFCDLNVQGMPEFCVL